MAIKRVPGRPCVAIGFAGGTRPACAGFGGQVADPGPRIGGAGCGRVSVELQCRMLNPRSFFYHLEIKSFTILLNSIGLSIKIV